MEDDDRHVPFFLESPKRISAARRADDRDAAGDDGGELSDSFEFSFATAADPDAAPSAAADEIFSGGRILPVFNRRPKDDDDKHDSLSVSSSSTEADEETPEGAYCVWTPRPPERHGRKSSSTGSSTTRRWRFRDLVRRCQSDGKDRFSFLQDKTAPAPAAGNSDAKSAAAAEAKGSKAAAAATEMDIVTAHRLYYSKGANQGSKGRRSFLPYKPIGLLANGIFRPQTPL